MASNSNCASLSILLFTLTLEVVHSQITVSSNIFDSLDKLGCLKPCNLLNELHQTTVLKDAEFFADALQQLQPQFKSMILAAKLEERFRSDVPATIFVFTDKTFERTPAHLRTNLYDNTERGARNYVQSFTLDTPVETSDFSSAHAYASELHSRGFLFLNHKRLTDGNVASGTSSGPTRYFVNGAMIVKANIKAGHHVIHIIDRVLEQPKSVNAIGYADALNPKKVQFKFFSLLMETLSRTSITDSEINYSTQVQRVLQSEQVTFFLPTDAAINDIPTEKLNELLGDPVRLLQIVTLHIVPKTVLFTSFVNHNEAFDSQMNSGRIIFRKNFNKEAVYVTGTRTAGGTVTARVQPANITVYNGVVHQIDQLLGFVYKTAIQEIETDPDSNNFEQIISSARKDLQNALAVSSGVTVFVPTNNALYAISNVYQNYMRNVSLINRVISLSLLIQGPPFSLTTYNRGYHSMLLKESRYNSRMIKIYSEGNETWAEGGYVRARVIKPDIGVTNGLIHQIDAVFGIPTRDIVYSIFCNDWLLRAYVQMQFVGLDAYMRDPLLVKNQVCSFHSGESGSPAGDLNVPEDGNKYSNELCGDSYNRCQFTFFVPNGTAIDSFAQMPAGRDIMNDKQRWRWILRRLISRGEIIYLDQLATNAPVSYIADNGERVFIRKIGQRGSTSGFQTTYIEFGNVRAEVLRSDIGATNGVIHIINNILFVPEDGIPTRDIVYSIFCNDWLLRAYVQMQFVGLDAYMRDPLLVKNQVCSFHSGESGSPAGDLNVPEDGNKYSNELCGDSYNRCQFTFFVPNGTAIDSFAQMPAGREIMNDKQRWRWILRRLISRRKIIYLDQLATNAPVSYIADNGERVFIRKIGQRGSTSGFQTTYIEFDSVRAEVLRSDIGATNGVIHIINNILFVPEDMNRDVSLAANLHSSFFILFVLTLFSMLMVRK